MSYGIGKDPRGFIAPSAVSLGITFSLVLLVALGDLVFALGTDLGESLAAAVGLQDVWSSVSRMVRYPLILAVDVLAVMVLHRFGPAPRFPFRSYLPGALFTICFMYVATVAIGLWFSHFQDIAVMYGIFGSVLVFILWLYIMAFVILVGGVINAVIHGQQPFGLDSFS